MTAAELFEVVRDVQKEAWPSFLRWHERGEVFESGYGFVHHEVAELLFVGSMVKWLQSQAFTIGVWEEVDRFYDHQDNSTKVSLSGTGAADRGMATETVFRYKSTVEALAAACKAVKP